MKALRTQFDQSGFSGAIATPTCSSSCCSCCCVATVVSASLLVGQEAALSKKVRRSDRWKYYLIPAGFWLSIIALVGSVAVTGLQVGLDWILLFSTAGYGLLLHWLFERASVTHPVRKAVLLSVLAVAIVWIEILAGMFGRVAGYSAVAILLIAGVYGVYGLRASRRARK